MSEALRKAAEQALAALESIDGIDTETECVTIDVADETAALRAALAEPEQLCKWPTCQTEEYQQKLADDVVSELIGTPPAQTSPSKPQFVTSS